MPYKTKTGVVSSYIYFSPQVRLELVKRFNE